jgi:hypothetical protein
MSVVETFIRPHADASFHKRNGSLDNAEHMEDGYSSSVMTKPVYAMASLRCVDCGVVGKDS